MKIVLEPEEKWFAIVNPVAGVGKGLSDWPTISRLLREAGIMPDYAFTEYKYHATELVVEAVNSGYRKILVVGGDGTIHEVVNGLFIQKKTATSDVLISVIAVGTGNDWIRMFGIPRRYSEAIRAITEGYFFLQDVAKLSFYKCQVKHERYMANVAGVGFDAYVNRKYNRLKERGKKGKWLYVLGAAKAVLGYLSTRVVMFADGEQIVNEKVYSATIGIGKYNGGGMLQVPDAIADDGLLDLTVIRQMNPLKVLMHFKKLYTGEIYKLKKVSLNRGRNIKIDSSPAIRIEVDGEALGFSPFEFQVIDKAIKVIVSERFLKKELDLNGAQNRTS